MLGKAIAISLVIGWVLGFVTFFGVRSGYKLLLEVLEENTKKEPLAYTGKVD